MVALQILSKILDTKDYSIIDDNLLTAEYFVGYEEEFNFITEHYKKYGNVPDVASFLSKFPDIELVDVKESDEYLIDTAREEYLYYKSVPVVQKIAELLKDNANAAAEYMIQAMKELQPNYNLGGVDIISRAIERLEQFKERKNHQEEWFFTTGFPELDDAIHGIQRSEEFLVIVARTNQCKSWVLEKFCTHIWQIGFNIGFISPEMSPNSVGYRFDTLNKNFSNRGLVWGKDDIDEAEYETYIDELTTHKNKFIVSTPLEFDRKITISKLRNFIKQHKLDILAVDGITYLSDERYKRGDNKTTSLTNISEDLMDLSMEMHVPILTVVQANRTGVIDKNVDDGTPELESVRDSDGIAHNASKVIALRQKENVITMGIKKQRFGPVGTELKYLYDIDCGEFTFIQDNSQQTEQEEEPRREKPKNTKQEDVF